MEKIKQYWLFRTFTGRNLLTLAATFSVFIISTFVSGINESSFVLLFAAFVFAAGQFLVSDAKDQGGDKISVYLFALATVCYAVFWLVITANSKEFWTWFWGALLYMFMAGVACLRTLLKNDDDVKKQSKASNVSSVFKRSIMAFAAYSIWFVLLMIFHVILEVRVLNDFAGLFSIVVYIGCLVYAVLGISAATKQKPTHWGDLIVTRTLYMVGLVVLSAFVLGVIAAVSGTMWGGIHEVTMWYVYASGASLAVLWFLMGYGIKQSLIMESNVRALEMYENKQRGADYEKK